MAVVVGLLVVAVVAASRVAVVEGDLVAVTSRPLLLSQQGGLYVNLQGLK